MSNVNKKSPWYKPYGIEARLIADSEIDRMIYEIKWSDGVLTSEVTSSRIHSEYWRANHPSVTKWHDITSFIDRN